MGGNTLTPTESGNMLDPSAEAEAKTNVSPSTRYAVATKFVFPADGIPITDATSMESLEATILKAEAAALEFKPESDSTILEPSEPTAEEDEEAEKEKEDIAEDNKSNSSNKSDSSDSNKAASFYIGDDQQQTAQRNRPKKPHPPSSGRKVHISEVPIPKAPEFIPPDGGYGWVIALAACMSNIWIVGFIKSYGVLYLHLRNAFPEATAYQASWLPALLTTLGLLIAPICGALCRKFTSRWVSFFGGLLAFSGLLFGSLAQSMTQAILSIGVLGGLGAGLITTPGILIVSLYFEKRRALSSAICVSGNALGGFFLPPLIEYTLEEYGLRGTLLLLAGMQLHICAASCLYRPITVHAIFQERDRKKLAKALKENAESKGDVGKVSSISNALGFDKVGSTLSKSKTFVEKVVTSLDLTNLVPPPQTEEEDELRRQVSFLRTASMMASIPDLTLYARSWSLADRSSNGSRSSMSRGNLEGNESKLSLYKYSSDTQTGNPIRLSSVNETGPETGIIPVGSRRSLNRARGSRLSLRKLSTRGQPNLSSLHELKSDSRASLASSEPGIPGTIIEEEDNEVFTGDRLSEFDENEEYEDELAELAEPKENKCLACFTSFIDIRLLANPLFVILGLSVALIATGTPHILFFLPAYTSYIELDASVTALLSISSIVDLFGRLGIGFFSDLNIVGTNKIYIASSAMAGISILCVPWARSFGSLGVLLGLYGFGVGSWFVLLPPILAEHHGIKRLAASYGLLRMLQGFVNFTSPQISGVLIDATQNETVVFYFMGCAMTLGSIVMLFERFAFPKDKKDGNNKV